MKKVNAVLFDLDGTILDTAPDLVFAINRLRDEHHLPALPYETIRSIVSLGSKVMIKVALGMEEDHPDFSRTRTYFLNLYERHLSDSTTFFPNMEQVFEYLDQHQIAWGIVTNKLTRHTKALLKALQFDHRPGCVICGDSLSTFKPDPAPILHACELLKQAPQHCLYVGDSETDVIASKAAGTQSLVALYGYINAEEDPYQWNADGYIHDPKEIITWLSKPTD